MIIPEYNDVLAAYERIKSYIHETPVLSSNNINSISDAELYFKCENFQKVGAFKFRGAMNAMLTISEKYPDQLKKGVATHSSGNHAQALALAARMMGVKAIIVMPETSPKVKVEAVKGYDAEIVFCKPTLIAREEALNKVVEEHGCTFIHPYNDPRIIAGQGTAALELTNRINDLDYVIAPVGGGGLLSGTLLAIGGNSSRTKVIAAEPSGADDAYRSLKEGRIIPSVDPKTIADGLLTSLGELTYEIIRNRVDSIVRVSEDNVIRAMKLIFERMKIVVEPSAATTLAAIFENPEIFKGKKCGLILSGGNVDLERLPW
jgi:threonine dehydratase